MKKLFKVFILTFVLLSFGFSANFIKREINLYINDLYSDKVNVIEKLYFDDNTSYDYKKKFLNKTFLLENVNLTFNVLDKNKIKTNLIGENLNVLEIKYTTKPFKILEKKGRIIKKVINVSSFNLLTQDSTLYLDNKTILKIFILKDINNNFMIPENIKNLANIYISENGVYLVYEFVGPKKIKDFQLIKQYMEPILYFDPFNVWNPFYILTFLIVFILSIIYFKDIVLFLNKVFK